MTVVRRVHMQAKRTREKAAQHALVREVGAIRVRGARWREALHLVDAHDALRR